MRPAPDTSRSPSTSDQSGAGSASYKVATQTHFAGPYGTGPRMVHVLTVRDGSAVAADFFPAANKAEALAIAEREGATFTY